MLDVLDANEGSDFRYRILHSVLDGVLDCDKLDYVRRDSSHLGVSFGLSIDHERLLRNLTVVWGEPTDQERRLFEQSRSGERHPGIAEIGVAEKAFAIAKSLVDGRKDMFRQVYWQHTVRSLKAMLAYVVRGILLQCDQTGKGGEFWSAFREYVFNPGKYYSPVNMLPGGCRAEANAKRSDGLLDAGSLSVGSLLDDDPADFPTSLSSWTRATIRS